MSTIPAPDSEAADGALPSAPPVFYQVDPLAFSFAEVKRMTSTSPFIKRMDAIASWGLAKVFRMRLPVAMYGPVVESLDPFLVDGTEVSVHILQKLAPLVTELEALGFHSPVFHNVHEVAQKTRHVMISMAHHTLPAVGRACYRFWEGVNPPQEHLFFNIISQLPNGTCISSATNPGPGGMVPTILSVKKEKASAAEILELHRQQLAASRQSALPARNEVEVLDISEHFHNLTRDYMLERKIFKPLSKSAERESNEIFQATTEANASGSRHPSVYAELLTLQRQKTTWAGAVLLLICSLILFFALGLNSKNSFSYIAALIPILLFHESGHWLAMKVSGYTNLRMFFIPGFGAAVSGRGHHVAGWKKVVVALAGPVPGIILGIIVGLVGMILKSAWVIQFGSLALLINGFNLLPIMPLDGGHVLHTILFVRHYILDIIFRVLALLIIFVGIVLVFDRAAIGLLVVGIMTLPHAVRVAKLASTLRQSGLRPTVNPDQTISAETCDAIVDEMIKTEKKVSTDKVRAMTVMSVFENINTRPPGALASIGLLSVHAIAFLAAVIFGLVLLVNQKGSFSSAFKAGLHGPRHSVSHNEIRQQIASQPASAATSTCTVVATFASRKDAQARYEELLRDAKPDQTVMLFGETVFIRLPESDESTRHALLDRLQSDDKNVFVTNDKMHVAFTINGLAPDAELAKKLQNKVNGYFTIHPNKKLIAPWSPLHRLTPQQEKARFTLLELSRVAPFADPTYQDLLKKSGQAARRGDKTEQAKLAQQIEDLRNQLEKTGYDKIVNDTTGTYDTAIAAEYLALKKSTKREEFHKQLAAKFEERLGTLPANTSAAPDYSASSGYAGGEDLVVTLDWLNLTDPVVSAPIVLQWLEDNKCSGIHYDMYSYPGDLEDESDGAGR